MKNVDIRDMVVWLKMANGHMRPFFRAYLVAITWIGNEGLCFVIKNTDSVTLTNKI